MRSPDVYTPPSITTPVTTSAIVVWIAVVLLALTAATLFLLPSPAHPVPAEILEGLTSPASFGARTT